MNQVKTGLLIKKLRLQMNLTQKQLAQLINVSDKAISKWECGNGCPDISSLHALSDVLKTDINIRLPRKLTLQFIVNNSTNQI